MVKVIIYSRRGTITGFHVSGHADDRAEEGNDVVCAGISALVINAINSIEVLTSARFSEEAPEEGGHIDFSFKNGDESSAEAQLLLSSMVLGLREIEQQYGNEYLTFEFKEV
ncbi:MAG: ribosomal-processing cysteine protease Prp [Clostridiales bacterium]|nr:ribosomal-processing cysteine protease Prp [Clostridiales bacterium]